MASFNPDDQPMYENPNGFPMAAGKTLHMDLGKGDLANRIVTVGTVGRADLIASNFDSDKPKQVFTSHRGFHTITGFFQGVHVSVVAIGIGIAMMDLFVREARAIVEGPMIICRFGTCGGIGSVARPGTIVVASQGAGYITRNPDAFHSSSVHEPLPSPYTVHKLVPSDQILSEKLTSLLIEAVGAEHVINGVNVTADSFYSSQGRVDERFNDQNAELIEVIRKAYPTAQSLEMESFTLLHLAHCCKEPIRASAAAIAVANRMSCHVIEDRVLLHMEREGGRAVLLTVATTSL